MIEVGDFYSELLAQKTLDLKTLPLVGFEFLSEYWISVNEKQMKVQKKFSYSRGKVYNYGKKANFWDKAAKECEEVDEDKSEDPVFTVIVSPDRLEKLEMLWAVVLESEIPQVYNKAIITLIHTHISLHEALTNVISISECTKKLIAKCFELIRVENPSPFLIKRVILVLQNIIQ